MPKDLILVGIIHGTHGVGGLLKVESLSDNPLRFSAGNSLYAALPNRESRLLTIERATPHQAKLLIAFGEIKSREEAQQLLGAKLLAEPAEPPPPGSYYHYQLLGLEVFQKGKKLGLISEILTRPANDVYVIQSEGGEEIWIPALKTVVKKIDLDAKKMEIELPEGLD